LRPGPGDLGRNVQTYSHYDVTHKKQNQNFYIFLNLNYKTFPIFRGFDQLSSSIGGKIMTG